MRVIFLTASPKRRGGASRYFASLLRLFLPGAQKTILPLRNRGDFSKALSALEDIDALCLCFPLYVDALPSHLIEFLALAEAHCREHACHFRVYALGNNGFIEGRQNRPRATHAARLVRAGKSALWRRHRHRRRRHAARVGHRLSHFAPAQPRANRARPVRRGWKRA